MISVKSQFLVSQPFFVVPFAVLSKLLLSLAGPKPHVANHFENVMGSHTDAQSVSAACLTSFVGREKWMASSPHD